MAAPMLNFLRNICKVTQSSLVRTTSIQYQCANPVVNNFSGLSGLLSRPLAAGMLRKFSSISTQSRLPTNIHRSASQSHGGTVLPSVSHVLSRTVVTCTRKKGQMRTVRDVPKRFYRLRCGLWIRTICGKQKRHWTRTPAKIWEIRQHLFCNQKQNEMLDKMVSRYYKRPRHWVNNMYEQYEERTGVTEGFKAPKRPFYP